MRAVGTGDDPMHEFVFSIEREPGVDKYTDIFDEHSSLQSRSITVSTCPNHMVRLESLTGDTGPLDAVTETALDPMVDRESINDRAIEATRYHDLLTNTSTRRIIYSYVTDIRYRDAVAIITSQYVSDGSLVETVRNGTTERYRLLLRSDEKVGLIYDTITARLGQGMSFVFEHLDRVDQWQNELVTPRALRSEQRQILLQAVDRGYFETPREVSIAELATELDIPESTASYRLRQATAQLAHQYAEQYQIQS
jgi:predicted DNA binding protein